MRSRTTAEDSAPVTLRTVLANREFRGLTLAYLQSTVGDQFAAVAVALLVYERTGSAAWTAAAYSLTMLPSLVSGPALSWIADRCPRRTVMVSCAWVQGLVLLVMALPGMPLGVLAGLLVAVQLVQTPYNAAQSASLPAILDARSYPVGQAFFDSAFNVGQLAGLAAAGVLVTAVGSQVTLALDAATSAVSALVIARVMQRRPAPAPSRSEDGVVETRLLGILRSDPRVVPLIAMLWMVSFAIVPEGLAVPLAAELHSTWAVGIVLAMDPGAYLLGLFVLSRWTSTDSRVRWIGVLCVLTVAPLPCLFLPLPLVPVLAILLVIGMAGAYHTPAKASLNAAIPDAWRGRVAGVVRVGLRAGQGAGIAVGGLVASATGSSRTAIALVGCAGLVAVAWPAFRWRRLLQEHAR